MRKPIQTPLKHSPNLQTKPHTTKRLRHLIEKYDWNPTCLKFQTTANRKNRKHKYSIRLCAHRGCKVKCQTTLWQKTCFHFALNI